MSKQFTMVFTNDPGHGWAKVPLAMIAEIGIAEQISEYSYMKGADAYLEEDRDAGVFLNAAKNAGWIVDAKDIYVENTPIRNYPDYSAERVNRLFGKKKG